MSSPVFGFEFRFPSPKISVLLRLKNIVYIIVHVSLNSVFPSRHQVSGRSIVNRLDKFIFLKNSFNIYKEFINFNLRKH